MMKILLVFVLFIANSQIGSAQIVWAPIGAKWHVSKIEGTMPPDEGYIRYEVSGDTLIQGKNVKVLSKTYFHSNGKDVTAMDNEYTYEKDSVVYYWKNSRFYTLYDFSARPGDKWTVYGSSRYRDYCNYDSLGVVVVDSVATVTINNQKLKAIYTSPDIKSDWHFEGVILERIGNITHLLPKSDGCLLDTPDEEGSLRCYEDSDMGVYKTGYCQIVNCDCNELKNYTSADDINNSSLQLYPNPVIDYLNIQCSNNSFRDFTNAEIYNMKGEKIATYINHDKCFVGFLNQGYYILKLSFSDQTFYYKFLKD